MRRIAIASVVLATISIISSAAMARQYGPDDEGKACKTSADECGTVTKDVVRGSTTFQCKRGGAACGMTIAPVRPMTEAPPVDAGSPTTPLKAMKPAAPAN